MYIYNKACESMCNHKCKFEYKLGDTSKIMSYCLLKHESLFCNATNMYKSTDNTMDTIACLLSFSHFL